MNRRIRVFASVLLGLVTFVAIGVSVHLSLDPDRYFRYSRIEYPVWSHPTGHVSVVAFIMLLEGAAAGLILLGPWPREFWIRGVIGASLMLSWAFLSTLFVVHMPGYVLFHHLWIWALSLFVSAAVVLSLAVKGVFRLWKARTKHGPDVRPTAHV